MATRRTTTYSGPPNLSFIGSAHGIESAQTITLKADKCLELYTDGIVKAGTVLGKITASGLYVPYDDTTPAEDGSENAAAILADDAFVGVGSDARDTVAPAYTGHIRVITANLPKASGIGSLNAGAKTDLAGRGFEII